MKKRIGRILERLGEGLYEREREVQLALLGALCGENLFLYGPPGVAKSLIARRIANAFEGGHYFEYLMQKFSTPEDIFGPVSLAELKRDNFVRKIDGYLPTADIAFLDEIFKASPSILNTLLTILNEKIFKNGTEIVKVPLKTLISASNEIPEEPGLEALYDRFLIRVIVNPLRHRSNFEAMVAGGEVKAEVEVEGKISNRELEKFKQEIPKVQITYDTFNLIHWIRLELEKYNRKAKRPIYISDRRWQKIGKLLKASAYFNDRQETNLTDIYLLKYCLWEREEDFEVVAEIVERGVEEIGVSSGVNLKRVAEEIEKIDQQLEGKLAEKSHPGEEIKGRLEGLKRDLIGGLRRLTIEKEKLERNFVNIFLGEEESRQALESINSQIEDLEVEFQQLERLFVKWKEAEKLANSPIWIREQEKLKGKSPGEKAEILADWAVESMNLDLARKAIALGRGVNNEKVTKYLGNNLKKLVEKLIEKEELEEAIEIASNIDWVESRDEIFHLLIPRAINNQMFDEAIRLAKNFSSSFNLRDETYQLIIQELVNHQMFNQAINSVKDFNWNSSSLKDKACQTILQGLANNRMFNRAIKLVEDCRWYSSTSKEEAYRIIIQGLVNNRMFDRAIELAENFWRYSNSSRDKAYQIIIQGLVDHQLFNHAIESAREFNWYSTQKNEAYQIIIQGLVDHQLFDQAIESARKFNWDWNSTQKDRTFQIIIQGLVNNRMFERAIELARNSRWYSNSSRDKAYQIIIHGLMNNQMFEQAIELVNNLYWDSSDIRDETYKIIIQGLVNNQMLNRAIELAKNFNWSCCYPKKDKAFKSIIQKLADNQMWQKAIECIGYFEWHSTSSEIEMIIYIAERIKEEKDFIALIDVANKISRSRERDEGYRVIIQKLANKQMFDLAIKVSYSDWYDGDIKSKALQYLSKKLAEAGRFDEAARIANNISNWNEREESIKYISEKIERKILSEEKRKNLENLPNWREENIDWRK
jgi:MoxR-like ATPase